MDILVFFYVQLFTVHMLILTQIPDYPKVGFWTIRAAAQGQIQDKKVEKKRLIFNF